MAYCSKCGNLLEENVNTCPSCGAAQNAASTPVIATEQRASGTLNVLHLVWAIINLLLCCTPLGIAGLIMTILAKDAPSAEEEVKKLKSAKICNLIGTIGGALVVIVYIMIVVVGAIASSGMGSM